jgi:hypothetical protein
VTRFRYRPERSHLGTIYRPVATVIVVHKEIVIELPLYIDSGADISMIPYRFGKALRLERTPETVLDGLEESRAAVFDILSSDSLSFSGDARSLREWRGR